MGSNNPNGLTQFQCRMLFLLAWILITLVFIAFLLIAMKDSPSIEIVVEISDNGFNRNTAYTGAATILGFAAFGSIVGVAVERGVGSAISKREALAMYGGAAVAITAQGLLMLASCCLGFNLVSILMLNIMTMAAATAAVLGVANVMGRAIRERQDRGEAAHT